MSNRMLLKTMVALLLGSVSACVEVVEPRTPLDSTLDGETIFRGLVFGEGPVAEIFPEVWGRVAAEPPSWTPEQREAARVIKRELITDIKRADPSFFERFHASMRSGQHVRIARAMDESAALFTAVVEARSGKLSKTERDEMGACVAITLAVAGNVLLVVNLAAFGNVAAYVNAVYDQNFFWSSPHDQGGTGDSGAGNSALQRDQVVQIIADRL
jgi:SdpC family antimicrobial peptide